LVANDFNQSDDVFFRNAQGNLMRIEPVGADEIDAGALLSGSDLSGGKVALLTDSPDVVGQVPVQQLVVVDRTTGEAQVLSSTALSQANDWVFSGVISPDGSAYGFSSAASNLSNRPIDSFQGDLFVAIKNSPAAGQVLVNGDAMYGELLTVQSSLVDLNGLGALQYQWLANGAAIAGATESSFALTEKEIGKKISIQVSFVDGLGTLESLTSANTMPVFFPVEGTSEPDLIAANGAYNILNGFGGDDILRGAANSKASLLQGGPGNDLLIGGDRSDKAVFEGNRSDYEIAYESGLFKVIDKRSGSPEGTDTLENLNLIQFADEVEFLPMAANRVALTGDETDNTVQVDQSQLYGGTRLAEIFIFDDEVSAMVMAGDGDTVVFQGSFADYDFTQLGSQLQVSKDGFVNTINVGGDVLIETDDGSVLAQLLLDAGSPVMMLGNQMIGDGFDAAALVVG
jgi:hypothetical protein